MTRLIKKTLKISSLLLPTLMAMALWTGAAYAQNGRHEHGAHDRMHNADDNRQHEGMHEESVYGLGKTVQAKIVDGVQVVEITVGPKGYQPGSIALKKGVPVRLVFTRIEDGGCAYQVQIPEFGIRATDLPLNKPVTVVFTPKEEGEFTFACGMDMMQGALLVKS